jgi:hypothetical protein
MISVPTVLTCEHCKKTVLRSSIESDGWVACGTTKLQSKGHAYWCPEHAFLHKGNIYLPAKLTWPQWQALISTGEVEDMSSELADGFLVVGQVMRALILWRGNRYYVTGWKHNDEEPFVQLQIAPTE